MKLTFEEIIYLITLFMMSLLLAKKLVDLIIKCKGEDIRITYKQDENILDIMNTRDYNELTEEINKKANKYLENSASAAQGDILYSFESVEKEFQEYPSLIYDGPFSTHIENMKPTLIENEKEISKEDGLKIAKEFLKEKGDNIAYSGETVNTSINSYSYSAKYDDREIYISISKKGGKVLYFLDTRNVKTENIEKEYVNKSFKDDTGNWIGSYHEVDYLNEEGVKASSKANELIILPTFLLNID